MDENSYVRSRSEENINTVKKENTSLMKKSVSSLAVTRISSLKNFYNGRNNKLNIKDSENPGFYKLLRVKKTRYRSPRVFDKMSDITYQDDEMVDVLLNDGPLEDNNKINNLDDSKKGITILGWEGLKHKRKERSQSNKELRSKFTLSRFSSSLSNISVISPRGHNKKEEIRDNISVFLSSFSSSSFSLSYEEEENNITNLMESNKCVDLIESNECVDLKESNKCVNSIENTENMLIGYLYKILEEKIYYIDYIHKKYGPSLNNYQYSILKNYLDDINIYQYLTNIQIELKLSHGLYYEQEKEEKFNPKLIDMLILVQRTVLVDVNIPNLNIRKLSICVYPRNGLIPLNINHIKIRKNKKKYGYPGILILDTEDNYYINPLSIQETKTLFEKSKFRRMDQQRMTEHKDGYTIYKDIPISTDFCLISLIDFISTDFTGFFQEIKK